MPVKMEQRAARTATKRIARARLHREFSATILPNTELSRQLVSFQASRKSPMYRWFKYKEGFSAVMVGQLIGRFANQSMGVLLDPFAGAGTSLFAAQAHGWNGIGIELLPVGRAVFEARLLASQVDLSGFRRAIDFAATSRWESFFDEDFRFRHVQITKKAFSRKTEREIAGFLAYCSRHVRDGLVRRLMQLACMCVLESISYTRKDGQYLRWDHRAGKSRTSTFNKGIVPPFQKAIRVKLKEIEDDIRQSRSMLFPEAGESGSMDYRLGSCLEILPTFESNCVDLVVTSPPYCNRYDYTRTYALELVFLGNDDEDIKRLRQAMLSCTVENREKSEELRKLYERLDREKVFSDVTNVFQQQSALHEALDILQQYRASKKLNNDNIPRMVANYFFEMSFVIYELARILRPGGTVVMVNDNVRYAGEEVPVDLILSNIAKSFGLTTRHIWTLQRGKGNSSQQMGTHGRTELRKCVYVWQK